MRAKGTSRDLCGGQFDTMDLRLRVAWSLAEFKEVVSIIGWHPTETPVQY